MVGTSRPSIAKLENGNANPNGGAMEKVLTVLGFRFILAKDSLI
jgi:predicted transcriptional regulator